MSNKNNDDLKRQASENTLGLNPVVGFVERICWLLLEWCCPGHQTTAAQRQARRALRPELKNVLFGKSSLQPGSDDRRFNDPAWSQNPLYRRYLQTYLAWRKELHDWIGDSNLSPRTSAAATSSST
jgi:polyhydroxyalkanoate synthase